MSDPLLFLLAVATVLLTPGPTNTLMATSGATSGIVPSLRLLVLHDDAEREFDYVSGSERALDRAAASGWTVVSIKDDWAEEF